MASKKKILKSLFTKTVERRACNRCKKKKKERFCFTASLYTAGSKKNGLIFALISTFHLDICEG